MITLSDELKSALAEATKSLEYVHGKEFTLTCIPGITFTKYLKTIFKYFSDLIILIAYNLRRNNWFLCTHY